MKFKAVFHQLASLSIGVVLKQQDMDMNNAIIHAQNINFLSLPALDPCETFCIDHVFFVALRKYTFKDTREVWGVSTCGRSKSICLMRIKQIVFLI